MNATMSKSARERVRYPRFKKGDVVALTEDALARTIKGRHSRYGVVASNPQRRRSVSVRRVDGRTVGLYWSGFWRHATPSEISQHAPKEGDV